MKHNNLARFRHQFSHGMRLHLDSNNPGYGHSYDLTQRKLAEMLGYSASYVGAIERGSQVMTDDFKEAMQTTFGIDKDCLDNPDGPLTIDGRIASPRMLRDFVDAHNTRRIAHREITVEIPLETVQRAKARLDELLEAACAKNKLAGVLLRFDRFIRDVALGFRI